jgi:hypothetical protein
MHQSKARQQASTHSAATQQHIHVPRVHLVDIEARLALAVWMTQH